MQSKLNKQVIFTQIVPHIVENDKQLLIGFVSKGRRRKGN